MTESEIGPKGVGTELRGLGKTERVRALALRRSSADAGAPEDTRSFFRIQIAGPGDDADSDGLPDCWETLNGLDPNDDGSGANPANGASGDPDNDGLTNEEEYDAETNPNDADSDDDGITDGGEIDQETDPNDSAATPDAEWFILTGYKGKEDPETKTRSRTVTIPAGESRLLVVWTALAKHPWKKESEKEFAKWLLSVPPPKDPHPPKPEQE